MQNITYNNKITPRRIKQLIMSIVFLLILVGILINPLFGFFLPACMVAGIGTGFFSGRKWCDWACPRGSFYEECLTHVSLKYPIPKVLFSNWFKIVVLVILIGIFGYFTVYYWRDLRVLGMAYGLLLTSTTLIGIILGFYFRPRVWCSFCPVGSCAGWLGARSKNRTDINL
jgi:ferredoxin-type protein NapH